MEDPALSLRFSKSRPALVLRVEEFFVAGQIQADVTIAYGSSQRGRLRSPMHWFACSFLFRWHVLRQLRAHQLFVQNVMANPVR